MAYRATTASHLSEQQDAGLVPLLLKGRIKQLTGVELTNRLMEASSAT
jgi:hypothetical protein